MPDFRIVLHSVFRKSTKCYNIRKRMTIIFPCPVLFNTVFIGVYNYIVSVILPECFRKFECKLLEAGWQKVPSPLYRSSVTSHRAQSSAPKYRKKVCQSQASS